jgi:hypothetical protein
MELSAYPRHRKRCLSGSSTSSGLFALNSPAVTFAPPSANPAPDAGRQPAVRILSFAPEPKGAPGTWGQLANAICQEASEPLPRTITAHGAFDYGLSFSADTAESGKSEFHSPESDRGSDRGGQDSAQPEYISIESNEICQTNINADGNRVEVYSHGACFTKDKNGQVIKIVCSSGDQISFRYALDGKLRSYTKIKASGEPHSTGELNGQSVIVRDDKDKVKALGENMVISANGCLTVHQFDGQFLSTDFVRELHAERRYVESRSNRVFCLTACFAFDGFRLMTNFQVFSWCSPQHDQEDNPENHSWSISMSEPQGPLIFHFYGRDGSFIQFDSQDQLMQLEPGIIMPAGSRMAANPHLAEGLGKTAWDSVNLYANSQWHGH